MRSTLYLMVVYFTATHSYIAEPFEDDVLENVRRSNDHATKQTFQIESNNADDASAKETTEQDIYEKAMMLKRKTRDEYERENKTERDLGAQAMNATWHAENEDLGKRGTKKFINGGYRLDPVLNYLDRKMNFRRKGKKPVQSSSDSSSVEMDDWKEEWKKHWLVKKYEAMNGSLVDGDTVNMVAARPWGVPCGDPGQHDMPWGSCVLPMQCEAEYRIYRGDYACGRSQFVCCALQLTSYDMNEGFDISFEDSGLNTDSMEKRNRDKSNKKRKNEDRNKKRRKERERRKRKIKKTINKIIKEIRNLLIKASKNSTSLKRKKTKMLKKYVADLKKKYMKERKLLKELNEVIHIRIDNNVMEKLEQIRILNRNFMNNATFRNILMTGEMTKQGARMLMEAYPDLNAYIGDKTRRSGYSQRNDQQDYDVEYGMLYY